jgi:hypothetical protein
MSDTTMTAAPSSFRVGAVLGRAFELLFREFFKFVGLAVIIWIPFLLIEGLSIVGRMSSVGFAPSPGFSALGWLGIVLFWASSVVVQAVILYGAFQVMRGQSFALVDSLKVGLGRFFPVIGLMIVMGIGIGLGTLLLVIPGAILYVMWSAALPACVVERRGPFDSLSRSADLTKGHRWRVFGVLVAIQAVTVLSQMIIAFILGAMGNPAIVLLGVFIWIVLAGAYTSISIAVIYHDLRVAKEGIDVDRIVAVFD